MIRRPPRSTLDRSSAASDVYKRQAYTRTIARPNYVDLVPYQLVFQEDAEIARGNSALKPTTSDNLDVLAERYFKSIGVVSGGVFYKRMSDLSLIHISEPTRPY